MKTTLEYDSVMSDIGEIPNFFKDESIKHHIRVEKIFDDDRSAWVLYDVITKEECEWLINNAKTIGMVEACERKDYRSNNIRTVVSKQFSEIILNRIKLCIDFDEPIIITNENKRGTSGIGIAGTWRLTEINNHWRFGHYKIGGHFGPHRDGWFTKDSMERSLRTFMLYLNDDFEGGTTDFIDDKQEFYKNEDGMIVAQEENILKKIKPVTGMAIVFNHALLHQGSPLTAGEKYIFRSDIMYRRDPDSQQLTTNEADAIMLYEQALSKEIEGKINEAISLYSRAYKLDPSLETKIFKI